MDTTTKLQKLQDLHTKLLQRQAEDQECFQLIWLFIDKLLDGDVRAGLLSEEKYKELCMNIRLSALREADMPTDDLPDV
ncbi:hypothetical protein W97_02289 [Coniosporium apollinis CBS 100218]|uniref:Uncharacterized protein n=1 Tax=Coniosporium apollinis (strain CBS 100218) TaxID=1168221 RepID=R7YMD6_CONA1|nr:uncharacterized protein W97_02289 [Coniosporium apollinis CBS 100218]EON63062.1 hypothetical protein W97_02289 [Coniosporium apollinis CBS 100218]